MPESPDVLTLQERVRTTLRLSESHFREFKSALEGPPGAKRPRDPKTVRRDIGETLVAFANADGGELLVGVEDNGDITGVEHAEQQIETFLVAWQTNVHSKTPLPRPTAVRLDLDGNTVLYFSVDKGSEFVHLTQDGRCLQRKDRESVPVPSEEIRFGRQERLSREYDRAFLTGADAGALDLLALKAVGQQIAPGLSPEKVLQLLDLADFGPSGLQLRRAAALLFAQDVSRWHPRCEVRLLRVSGTELRTGRDYNVVSDSQVSGNILSLLQSSWDAIRPFLVETRLGPDGRFQEQVRYPEDACREALTNAMAHRDYTIEGRAIEVYIFDDRLEVRSPGALLSTVTIEGLRKLEGIHQSRNTTITRTLRELGYMREMGEGFRRIFQLMKAHDLMEPDFYADTQSFVVSLKHQSIFSQEDQRWISGFDEFLLERDEEKVLLLGRTGQTLSVQQIMDAVDLVDTEDYRALIERLQVKGLIVGTKRPRSGVRTRNSPRWTVVQPIEAAQHLSELIAAAVVNYRGTSFARSDLVAAADQMEPDNPILSSGRPLGRSLLALDLIDTQNQPTVKLRSYLAKPDARRGVSAAPIAAVEGAGVEDGSQSELVEDAEGMDDTRIATLIAEDREPRRLFIANLPFDTGVDDLGPVLREFGIVVDLVVPRGYRGKELNRGYAFVEYSSHAEAKSAKIAIDGYYFGERTLHTDWASSGRSK